MNSQHISEVCLYVNESFQMAVFAIADATSSFYDAERAISLPLFILQ